MKLTVKDRLVLPSLYPEKGDIKTQVLVRDIKQKVEFTQDEVVSMNLRQEGQAYLWDGNPEMEVDFTEAEIELLKAQAERLSDQGDITQDNLDLVLKIQE